MDENSNIYDLKSIEKNYGLTPADCLILEIQKPKFLPSMRHQNEMIIKKNSKKILNTVLLNNNIRYKDPKVSY